jgi:hypothetical protein
MQPVKAVLHEPATALAHRRAIAAEPRRDRLGRLAIGYGQHDSATQGQRLRTAETTSPPREHPPLLLTRHNLRAHRHGHPHRRRLRPGSPEPDLLTD